ncbi:ferritin-like domain-containing protein [Trichloromonas sp.]|uniref:ferritin-like domain-containing protein n=1 Tax=Trichloromonas sp. TaxID=3069249 RepID=UPI003D8138FD
MKQLLDLQQAIRAAMQTEKDAMDFYRLAAQKMTDPEASCRFAQLAREERQHAYSFFNVYRGGDIHSFEEFLAEPPNTGSDWWAALKQLEAAGFAEKAALRLAIEQEHGLEKTLREAAEQVDSPEVKAIYLANASSTRNHCRSIEKEYAEKYGELKSC